MATNWSQVNHDDSGSVESEDQRYHRDHHEALVPRATHPIDHLMTDRVEAKSLPTAGYTQRKIRLLTLDVMLMVVAGVGIFYFLDVASFGVLAIAVTVAGIVTTVGLGHCIVWGRE